MHPRSIVVSYSREPPKAAAITVIYLPKVLLMLPPRRLMWATRAPVIERIAYPALTAEAQVDLYRPVTADPHSGMVIFLGVVPFDIDQRNNDVSPVHRFEHRGGRVGVAAIARQNGKNASPRCSW